jgi:3-dehydroquinate synthase
MDEYTGGMAEVVKHALIGDADLFGYLEDHLTPVFSRRDRQAVADTIERAVQVKAEVVSADEREEGRRAILNFGHTFAHAIEAVAGYGTFSHGEAVAVGMRAGLHLSHRRHPEAIPRDRADHLIRAIPVEADPARLSFDALYRAMGADKKNEGATIRFVILDRLGHATVTDDVSRSEAEQAWRFACSS